MNIYTTTPNRKKRVKSLPVIIEIPEKENENPHWNKCSRDPKNSRLNRYYKKWLEEFEKESNSGSLSPRDISTYTITNAILGRGGYGTVKRAYEANKEFAIKIIDTKHLKKFEHRSIINEIKLLSKLNHKNIIKFIGHSMQSTYIYMIFEPMGYRDLFTLIHLIRCGLNEDIASYIIYEVLSAVKYLHSLNIVHRDIKPENVLLNVIEDRFYPEIKLCDFGLASEIDENGFLTRDCGSRYYASPEMLRLRRYNKTTDIWSLGVLSYVCIMGGFPYDRNEIEVYKKYGTRPKIAFHSSLSDACVDFICNALTYNRRRRPTATELMGHDWLKPVAHMKSRCTTTI